MYEVLASVALAAARWVTYASILPLIGAAGLQVTLRRVRSAPFGAMRPSIDRRVGRLLLVGSLLWVLASASMLAAQLYAWFGVEAFASIDRVHIMLTQSVWGAAWSAEFGAATLSVGAAGLATRWPRCRVVVSVAIILGIVLTVPATGHAASHGALVASLYVIHLLGGGLWLGTLATLTIVTWPLWRRESAEAGVLRAVLTSFTPVALFGAGLLFVSGTLLTFEHVDPLTTILNSDYGRTLAAKAAVVGVIAFVGWRNWRRLRPQAEDAHSRDRLRRSALLELGLAFLVVLILTAWLSGLPMPRGVRLHHH